MKTKTFGFITGVVFTLVILGVFIAPLCGYLNLRSENRALAAENAELKADIAHLNRVNASQGRLIEAYRQQTAATASILGTIADTLDGIAYGPYTRAEIQDKLARVAGIILEVNEILTPEEAGEISQAIVGSSIAAGIDPLLLTAMAILESDCRPNLRGQSGEYGMLQVMPGTGAWIAGRLGYADWQPADMWDIRQNVQFSAFYLRAVTSDMGSLEKGILAYNRGPTGARGWLAEHQPEEHCYVARVLSIYQNIGG